MNQPNTRAPRPPLVETSSITLTVTTRRHGTLSFQAILRAIDRFTYGVEVPQFDDIGCGSDNPQDAIDGVTDQLKSKLDARSTAYWRKRGIL